MEESTSFKACQKGAHVSSLDKTLTSRLIEDDFDNIGKYYFLEKNVESGYHVDLAQ